MQNLPRLVNTYDDVTGNNNPFAGITGIETWGYTAVQFNDYMHLLHGMTPVMNDYLKLQLQIAATIAANAPKYNALYRAQTAAADLTPTQEINYTDVNAHTGTVTDGKAGSETKTRTGNVADSGTDSTANGGTVTDSTKTYDNDTFKELNKSVSSVTGSVTHGKTTTYNSVADELTYSDDRLDTKTYGNTDTRTVTGYRTNPMKLLEQYTEFARTNNVFMAIINDVIQAISCIIYIPVMPENTETEE